MTGAEAAFEASLFEHAPVGYVVIDRSDGTIQQANLAFLALTGRTREQTVGATLTSMLTVAGRIFGETHLRPMLDLTGHVDEVALDVLRPDGVRVPVLLSANVVKHEGRELTRAVLFEARDRRHYETELLRSARAAEEARAQAVALSKTLQKALIPPVPPTIPRLQVAAVYRPAGNGEEVGGDFYDVFNVGPREWVVVVGDVAGKGIPAATITAYVRHQVRDLAMRVLDPAELLHALDAGLHAEETDRFCTVALLRLHDRRDGWHVTGAAGGHPLPLLGRRDGRVTELGVPGSLVGILDDPVFTTFDHQLADDESITLYTDGVTEARHGRAMLGVDELVRLVGSAAAEPSQVPDVVLEAALVYQDHNTSDDIAVLTLHPSR